MCDVVQVEERLTDCDYIERHHSRGRQGDHPVAPGGRRRPPLLLHFSKVYYGRSDDSRSPCRTRHAAPRLHADRTAGRHRHHRRPDRPVAPRRAKGARRGRTRPSASPTCGRSALACTVLRHPRRQVLPAPPVRRRRIANTNDNTNSFAEIYWEDKLMPFIGGAPEADEAWREPASSRAARNLPLPERPVGPPALPGRRPGDGVADRTSYLMNSLLSHKTRRYGEWTLMRFVNEVGTSKFVAFSERNATAFTPADGGDPARTTTTSGWAPAPSGRGSPDRHSGVANYLYLDGHVATLTWDAAVVDMYPIMWLTQAALCQKMGDGCRETFSVRCALGLLAVAGLRSDTAHHGLRPARRKLSTITKTFAARTRGGPRPRMGQARRQPERVGRAGARVPPPPGSRRSDPRPFGQEQGEEGGSNVVFEGHTERKQNSSRTRPSCGGRRRAGGWCCLGFCCSSSTARPGTSRLPAPASADCICPPSRAAIKI